MESALLERPMAVEEETEAESGEVFKWSAEAYMKASEMGLFGEKRVELIEGEIIEMSPIDLPHWKTTIKVDRRLRSVFGFEYLIAVQSSLQFGELSAPEPDISVVKANLDDLTEVPSFAVLVIEVSDTTLSYDRNRKAALYASRGIQDYWIVNLRDNQLEVRRQPRATPTARYSHGFASLQILEASQSVSPLEAPQILIPVADLLP